MKDASQNPIVASQLLNSEEEAKLESELDNKYRQMRDNYGANQKPLASIEEARKNKLNMFD